MKIATSLNDGRLPGWNVIDWSMIPMPIAAIAIVGSRSMRPITAAARAWSRKLGPSTWPTGRPTTVARRNMATNARTLAITQTIVFSRMTGTPRVAARSPRSAAPRIAVPKLERCMKRARAMKQTGTTKAVVRSAALKMTPGRLQCIVNGGSRRGATWRSPNQSGMNSATAVSSCAMPMVATVTTRRGDL